MGKRTRRFARLRPAQSADGAEAVAGDLFEHFGVPAEPPPGPVPALSEPQSALPCPDCGWYRATPLVEACSVCGSPPRGSEPDAAGDDPDEADDLDDLDDPDGDPDGDPEATP